MERPQVKEKEKGECPVIEISSNFESFEGLRRKMNERDVSPFVVIEISSNPDSYEE